ncbi:MAG TPA: methylated-DNA--[protein]-cysteine S-methyltransferase [Chromatiaceae bacterium]|nr:methylated-DNA--[protein]-cysteine S-methyltransferase [Chromatiaceae bacterium]
MSDIDALPEFQAVCKLPFGWVAVATDGEAVNEIRIVQQRPASPASGTSLANKVCKALQHWFAGGDWPSDIPVNPAGTDYQKKVWRALQEISCGETRTYGELAGQLGSAPRAVGGACRRNPIPLLIPCHRVVAANGDGGFAGHTEGHWLDVKRWLLSHE